jgi:hypothetical protein
MASFVLDPGVDITPPPSLTKWTSQSNQLHDCKTFGLLTPGSIIIQINLTTKTPSGPESTNVQQRNLAAPAICLSSQYLSDNPQML